MLHTVIPVKTKVGPDLHEETTYDVALADRPGQPIMNFKTLDDASHMCNRLNGGHSKDISIFLDMLKQFHVMPALGGLLSYASTIAKGAVEQMNKDKEKRNGR